MTHNLTPDKLAAKILVALPKSQGWRYDVDAAAAVVQFIFRTKSPSFLDLKAVMACFIPLHDVSWQGPASGNADTPCIVIKGGLGSTVVQAVFVLHENKE